MEAKIDRKFRVLQEIAKDHDASSWQELGPVCVTYYKGLLIELHALLGTCTKTNVDRLETRVRLLSSYARNSGLVTICLKVATSLVLHCGKFEMGAGLKNTLKVLLCLCLNLAKVDGEAQEAALAMALSVRMGTKAILSDAFRRMSEDVLLSQVRLLESIELLTCSHMLSHALTCSHMQNTTVARRHDDPLRIFTDMTIATCFLYLSNVCVTVPADVLICGFEKLMKLFRPGGPIKAAETAGIVERRDAYFWAASTSAWSLVNCCVLEGDAAARLSVAMMGGRAERTKMIEVFVAHEVGGGQNEAADDTPIRHVAVLFCMICKDESLLRGATRLAPRVACGMWDWLVALERVLRAIAVERPARRNIERVCEVVAFGVDILSRTSGFTGQQKVDSGHLFSSLACTAAKVGRLMDKGVVSEAADRAVYVITTSMPTGIVYKMNDYNVLAPIDVLSCNNPDCVNLDGPHDAALKTFKCGSPSCCARYCSAACQKRDWTRRHKGVCCSIRS